MTNSIHAIVTGTFAPLLRTLSMLLDKGAEHVSAEKRDPATLLEARLAPDMFPLVKQVQIACDQAKNGAAILADQTPPRFEDNEKTIPQLQARIARTVDYLETFSASAFDAAADRAVKYPLQGTLVLEMNGLQFLRDWTLPNFYFHLVTAYDILRHNGVNIGKRDFLSHISYAFREQA